MAENWTQPKCTQYFLTEVAFIINSSNPKLSQVKVHSHNGIKTCNVQKVLPISQYNLVS